MGNITAATLVNLTSGIKVEFSFQCISLVILCTKFTFVSVDSCVSHMVFKDANVDQSVHNLLTLR